MSSIGHDHHHHFRDLLHVPQFLRDRVGAAFLLSSVVVLGVVALLIAIGATSGLIDVPSANEASWSTWGP
jgi:hypothetical protein